MNNFFSLPHQKKTVITPPLLSQVSVEYSSIPKSISGEMRRLPLESKFSHYSADGIHYQWILFYPDFAASLTSNFQLLGQSEKNSNITKRTLNETSSFSTSLRFSGQRMNEGDLRSRRRSRILSCRISRYKWSPNRVFLAQHTLRMAVHIHC